ncbi:uncharacterized protein LOC106638857 [Copidosoma floridanum]|uniref:uncharacterized protein LOC106638857 n=1 Tax=Copidosoma floridanum TaxID=29053 RepID=UPI0006C9D60E|nr:uncharacterized protein LOC106638857 [Copidosoma floridanum]
MKYEKLFRHHEQRDLLSRLLDVILANDIDLVQSITNLEKIDISKTGLRCHALLYSAISHGHLEIAEWLLNQNCPVNASDDATLVPWSNALHAAVYYRHNVMVANLLARGAHTTARNPEGQTPLYVACDVGNVEALELLLSEDKSAVDLPDKYMHSPLHVAVEKECLEAVQLLLGHGADVNARTGKEGLEGCMPMHIAVIVRSWKIIQALLSRGADINAAVGLNKALRMQCVRCNVEFEGLSPLHLAVTADAGEMITKLLLDHQANVNAAVEHFGTTPLHLAVRMGNKKIVSLFNDFNADFLARTEDGKNAFHLAVEGGWCELAEELFLKNADVSNAADNGDTPFHIAVRSGLLDLVKAMIDNGVDVNLKNSQGQTPLHLAARSSTEVTRLLLEEGASVDETDADDQTPLSIAIKSHFFETSSLILKYKPSILVTANKVALIYAFMNFKECKQIGNSLSTYSLQLLDDFANSNLSVETLSSSNYMDLIENILSNVSSENSDFKLNDSFIYPAKYNGSIRMVKLLLKYSYTCFNFENEESEKLVDYAIESSDFEMLKTLFSIGAKVQPDHVRSIMKFGDLSLLKIITDNGIDVNKVDEYGTTALHFAVWYKQTELVNYLINEKKVCINTMEKINYLISAQSYIIDIATSPLHIAVMKKNQDIVLTLLVNGADVNCKNGQDATVLHYATKNASDLDMIKMLLKHGANINVVDGRKKLPAYYIFNQTCICDEKFRLYYDLTEDCHCDIAENFDEYVVDEVVKIYLRHIIYLTITNKIVHPDNINILSKCKSFGKLQISHFTEVTKMKVVKIFDNVSFYDVLVKKRNALAAYGRNKELVLAFETSNYKHQFPLFAEILLDQFIEAQRRAPLLDSAGTSLQFLVNYSVPQVVLSNIFDNLSSKDLNNVTLAEQLYHRSTIST